MIKKFNIVLWR